MRYDYSDEGLERIGWAGLTPGDVMRALNSEPSFRRHDFDEVARLTVRARSGSMHLVVGLEEDRDDLWVVVGARRMDKDEIAQFERLTRGGGRA